MSEIERALDVLYSPPTHSALPTVRWVQPVSLSNPEPCGAPPDATASIAVVAPPPFSSGACTLATPLSASGERSARKRSGGEPKKPSQRGHIKVAWSKHEDQIILSGVRCYGLKWSKIVGLLLAAEYPARTDDAVRNRWQRLVRKQQAVAAARAEAELEAADAASSSSADASTTADVAAPLPPVAPATLYHAPEMMGGMGNDDTALVSPAAELSMPLLENPDDRFSPTNGDGALLAPAWAQQLGLGLGELPGGAPHAPAAAAPPPATATALVPAPAPAAPAAETAMEEAVEGRGGDMWTAEEDRTIDEGVRLEGLRWREVAEKLPGRTASGCRNRWVRTQERNFAADGRAVRGAVAVFAALRAEGRISKRHKWERRDHRRRGGPADVGFRGELPSELVV